MDRVLDCGVVVRVGALVALKTLEARCVDGVTTFVMRMPRAAT
jgi:hypothetical protein